MSAVLERDLEIRMPEIETSSYHVPPREHGLPSEVPLFEFQIGETRKRLATPITLRVSFEAGKFAVENETLSLFGTGNTLQEAVVEFLEDVAYFWDYYRSLPQTSVTGRGALLKQIYAGLAR